MSDPRLGRVLTLSPAQERALIDDYVRSAGHDPQLVRTRTDEAARMLLLSAAAFVASRLRREARSS